MHSGRTAKAGVGLIYETHENSIIGSLGLSGVAGFGLAPNVAPGVEVFYTPGKGYHVRALSYLAGLKFLFY